MTAAGVFNAQGLAQTAHFSGTQSTLGTGLYLPQSTAVDTAGDVFIADTANNQVLKETLANGSYTQSILAGSLALPDAVAVDSLGNVYIADTGNNRVLKETPSGSTYTQSIVGSGIYSPQGIAVDASGNVFVADTFNDRVLKETFTAGVYVQSTVVSSFTFPNAVAVDANGNVYIANGTTGTVYKESPSGSAYVQSVVALGFSSPLGIAVDGLGDVYIADTGNSRIVVEHLSGGTYTQTVFLGGLNKPDGVTVDAAGTVYIADTDNDRVLRVQAQTTDLGTLAVGGTAGTFTLIATIDSAGALGHLPVVVTKGATGLDFTDAGTGSCTSNGPTHVYSVGDTCTVDVIFRPIYAGERDGAVVLEDAAGVPIATAFIHGIGSGPQLGFPVTTQTVLGSGLSAPSGVAVDGAGNIYVADTTNNRVLKETLSGGSYTQSVVGSGMSGPYSVAVDGAGNLYIADTGNSRILLETPGNGTYAQGVLFTGLDLPYGVTVDGTGTVYIADTFNSRVLKETLSNGSYSQSAVGSGLSHPYSVAVDSAGNLYIGDNNNSDGVLKETSDGSGGYTQSTVLAGPMSYGMVVDASGKVYLTQSGSNKILKETPSGSGYTQTTTSSGLTSPRGIALDDAGNVYVGDTGNNRILRLDQVDPPALAFAATDVGMTSSDSPQTITLHNNGNAPLIFPVPAVSGGSNPSVPANFAWDSTATCPLTTSSSSVPFTLAAGVTCTVGFSFQPGTAGTISGTAVLTDNTLNAASATQAIPLSGTGVTPDMTATHVTVSANSVVSGGTVNLLATVSDITHSGSVPTGSVTFYDTYNGVKTAPVGPQTISNGQINLTNYMPAGAGSHLITAVFTSSSATYAASADSTGQVVTVANDATTTQVTVSANSIVFGGTVNLLATVSDITHSGSVPTGSVTFYDTYNGVKTAPVGPQTISNGQINLTNYMPAGAGSHLITAVFTSSSATYAASADTTGQTVSVAKGTPVVTWPTPAPITYGTVLSGMQLDATASIAGNFVYTPTVGAVLEAGAQSLHTVFTPTDTTDYNSVSASVNLTVNQQSSSIVLAESATSGVYGQPVTLTAKVTPTISGTPTGSVLFSQSFVTGGHYVYTLLAAVPLSNGTASYQAPLTGGSSQGLTAIYNGDTNYTSSNSNQVNYNILPAIAFTLSSSLLSSGSPVTLTASVQYGSTPVTPGQVAFCDATAPRCTEAHLLGTAQLTSAGTATLKLIPSIGVHSYKAVFLGTYSYNANASASAPVTVTGVHPSISSITASGVTGNYTLTGTVSGMGAPPAGSVAFLDTSNANYLLGTATLVPGAATLGFTLAQTPATGTYPNAIATGDFNGDGKPDLVVTGSQANTLTILLGNGNGTFSPAATLTGFNNPSFVATADFNSDGKTDIVVANTNADGILVLLGNGDGTFAAPISHSVGSSPYALTVGDFNLDGIADVAAANSSDGTVTVLLGNGDGTFNSGSTLAAGSGPTSIVAADFNNDGRPDLAVTNINDASVSLFFGVGDGTFSSSSTLLNVGTSFHLVAADLNGDGDEDLAVANSTGGSVTVLLGKGNGSFVAAASAGTGPTPNWITSADVNGDGIPDLITSNRNSSGSVSILLGNGDGTYRPAITQAVGSLTNGVVAADFNGDGFADLAAANSNDNTASILLTQVAQTASASISGVAPVGTGNHLVEASFPGTSTVGASTSSPIAIAAQRVATALTLNASPGSSSSGQAVTLTATLSPTSAQGHSTDGETVVFTTHNGTSTLGTGTLSGGVATLHLTTIPGGNNTLAASYAGDTSFSGSVSPNLSFTVSTATTTTLAITANGVAATSVASGTAVTLTATVTNGAISVTPGLVLFCDASAAHCTDIHRLGAAQLTSAGVATINLIPSLGSHSYKAVFTGSTSDLTSASTASALTVTGLYATRTTVAQSGSIGNYTMTASVATSSRAGPTGTVSFLDTSNANYVLGSAALGAGTGSFSLLNSQTAATGTKPNGFAVADFNGDGKPDLAIPNQSANSITILLGNGDGTFAAAASPPASSLSGPLAIAAADFNSDGKPDLAIVNYKSNTVSILLGNGDGTFTPGTPQPVGSSPYALAVGDFNSDGIADIAVVNSSTNTVSILLGRGDGTFSAAASPVTGNGPTSVVTADFNNDGVLDLAVTNFNSGTLTLLFGAGDGSFPTNTSMPVSGSPSYLAVADLNGDGNPDLAVAVYNSSSVPILLGRGDGTFSASSAALPAASTGSIAVGDLDGDGNPDLVVTNGNSAGLAAVLLGHGDGTFSSAITQATGADPQGVIVVDFNGDGYADLVTANNQAGTASIFLAQPTQVATASISGISPVGTGTHLLDAGFPGTATLGASTSAIIAVTAQPVTTALTLGATPAASSFGQPVTLTATLSPVSAQNHTVNGETITFRNGTVVLGTGTLSSGVASLTTSSLTAGNANLTASYIADGNFTSSASSPVLFTVTPAATTLTLSVTPAAGTVASGIPVTLTATLSGAAPLTVGQVRFCDASFPSCTGLHLLGTAQLTNTLTATLKVVPGIGIHSYKAVFGGSVSYATSSSATTTLTVTGRYSTSTSLTASGPSTGYTLTATVTGTGGTTFPTGPVAFNDNTHSTSLGSVALSSATAALNFANAATLSTGNSPQAVASADFNGDGIVDLAIANAGDNTVSILPGRGDGTFAPATNINAGSQPQALVAGDFNDDGIADLAVANSIGGTVTILLGNGDGTFTASTVSGIDTPTAITSADFNNDGIADLALTNTGNNTVILLLGHGDGTFTLFDSVIPTGNSPQAIAAADLNGDGVADLVIANSADDMLTVLLGRGDGTFTSAANVITGALPVSVVVTDLNGDGIPDLAVANSGSNTLTVLLGKGDGTFTPSAIPVTVSSPRSLALGDFNHDDIPDLAVANAAGNTVSILLGKGDGSFTISGAPSTGSGPQALLVADFNGDGTGDLAVVNTAGNNASILLTQIVQTASATLSGVTEQGTGTYTAAASYPGDANYTGSSSTTVSLTTVPFPAAAPPAFSPAPGNYTSAQTVTLSDSTPGAAIFYTTDGSVPTAASIRFTAPITVTANQTISAIAAATGYQTSPVATAAYVINYPPKIGMEPSAQTIIATGKTATLMVGATGTAPLTYQWFAGSSPNTAAPIAGATQAVFTTGPLNSSANYWVQVNNASQIPANSTNAMVTVYSPPVCTLSVQPAAAVLDAVATVRCSDPQNQALTQTLTWGDGSTPVAVTSTSTTIHTYKAAQTYTVTLTATDTAGLSVTLQQQISPNQSPVCTLGIVQGQVSATLTQYPVSVSANCTDPQNLTFANITLDWGDGNPVMGLANNATYTHTYTSSTTVTYNVVLTATDTAGISGSSAPQPVQIVPAQAIAPGGSSPVATMIPAPTITPSSPVTPPATQVTFLCSSVSATLNGQTVNNALPSAYGITCSSPTVTLSSAPTPVNVTISTTGAVASLDRGPSPLVLCGLIAPFAGLAFVPGRRRRQIVALSVIFVLGLSLSACGGYFTAPGATATPSGIYYITLVETVVNPPAPTGFIQTSLIVPLPVTPSAKP